MIIITGAAGFIGSCLIKHINLLGYHELIIVDEFENIHKNNNLLGKSIEKKIHRDQLFDWLAIHFNDISFIFHLGARTDTTEKNTRILNHLNLNYSKRIWKFCVKNEIPLVYASSAATYGLGEHGFLDNHLVINQLAPLNPYGDSKNDFDKWAVRQINQPPKWIGLKFFNVYGPNEYHKGRMASVIFHTFHQIQETGKMKLFRSHHSDFKDGQQSRDFIYIKDLVKICVYFFNNKTPNGLYNVGTGKGRTFWDLACNTFTALTKKPKITFIDTPLDIRANYQYFTQADISKLRQIGYNHSFYDLEAGIKEYVLDYLLPQKYI